MYSFVDATESVKGSSLSLRTIFNGVDLDRALTDSQGRFVTLGISGRGILERRINLTETSFRDGAREGRMTYGVREIQIEFLIEDVSNRGFRDRFKRLNRYLLGQQEKLQFTDEDVYYWATLKSGDDPLEDSNSQIGALHFICSDPYKYGEERTIELSPQTTYVDVSGHVETPWKTKSTITLPQSEYTLDLRTSKITITYNFIAGDVLEIDYKKREILLNGKELDKGLSLESSWGLLQPGNFGLSASQPTTLTYTERYN